MVFGFITFLSTINFLSMIIIIVWSENIIYKKLLNNASEFSENLLKIIL